MLVTDAMPSVGSDLTEFTIDGRVITRKDGRLTTADGTIAGSDLDMATRGPQHASRHLGLPLEAALAHGLAARRPSFSASATSSAGSRRATAPSLVLLDDDLRVTDTWIDGVAARETGG